MSEKFDQLTRTLAQGKTRRSLLSVLGGAAIAVPVATLATIDDADAKRRRRRRRRGRRGNGGGGGGNNRCARLGDSCGGNRPCCGGEFVSACLVGLCVSV